MAMEPQPRLGGGGDDVGEHPLLLDQQLVHIGYHPPRVAQGVPFIVVVGDELLVLGIEDKQQHRFELSRLEDARRQIVPLVCSLWVGAQFDCHPGRGPLT